MFLKALDFDNGEHTPSRFHLGLMQHKNGEFKEYLNHIELLVFCTDFQYFSELF